MRESSTYQAILEEGRAEGRAEERRAILRALGVSRFGPPSPETLQAIEAVTDPGRLERMLNRLLHAADWVDLLATL